MKAEENINFEKHKADLEKELYNKMSILKSIYKIIQDINPDDFYIVRHKLKMTYFDAIFTNSIAQVTDFCIDGSLGSIILNIVAMEKWTFFMGDKKDNTDIIFPYKYPMSLTNILSIKQWTRKDAPLTVNYEIQTKLYKKIAYNK